MAQEPYQHQPWDIDTEQSLLGAMLRDNQLIDIAAADMDSGIFYDHLHARIFEMMIAMRAEGAVNPRVLHAVMKHDPGVIETGGQPYFDALRAAAPAMPAIREYGTILKELSYRRQLIALGNELVAGAYEPPKESPSRALADRATEALIYIGNASVKAIVSAQDTALESLREAERAAMGESIPVVSTGLYKVDKELGGFRGGDFIVIAGKSGMGKSALMVDLALKTSAADIPTIVFSLEMTRRQVVERMVCSLDYDRLGSQDRSLWYSRIRNGHMTNEEFDRFAAAMQHLPGPNRLEIHDEDGLTVQQISARARAFAAKFARNPDGTTKLGVVIVDYIQIVEPSAGWQESRERQVAGIARGLKSLAKKLGWPVIAGSQFNDDDKHRAKEEKRPQINDARESKAIGNEADLFLSPYRPAYFVENRKPMDALPDSPEMIMWKGDMRQVKNRFDLLVLKNRHGRRFDVSLQCDIAANAIRDYSRETGAAEAAAEQAHADLLEELG